MSSNDSTERRALREAAQWLRRLHDPQTSAADRQAWAQWRDRSPEHARAWALAEKLQQRFETVPSGLGLAKTLEPSALKRREALRALSVLLVMGPAAWVAYRLPWAEWSADYKTAIGERQQFSLADGSSVMLNTASAVNVRFDQVQRQIRLVAGEILVTVKREGNASHRPFVVESGQGTLRAMGTTDTQFSVRQDDRLTRVAVLDGTVEIRPARTEKVRWVRKGEECAFVDSDAPPPSASAGNAALWARGLLFADRMRMVDFVAELARYHAGRLQCDTAIADLRVSGIYQTGNVRNILVYLEHNYPVRVREMTRYWITIEPSKPSST